LIPYPSLKQANEKSPGISARALFFNGLDDPAGLDGFA
jgi:hypothetical protein